MRRQAIATAWAVSLFASLAVGSSQAADLIWEVENPFRFFKPTKSFALHEAAYVAVRGDPATPLPTDIVWRTERRLNDPDCKDPSHPDKCAATAGKRYQQSRLGWAAQTVGETCYDSNGRPRRYSALCERKYSWGSAKEDYVLPDAHTVTIRIAPQHLAGLTGDCIWQWQPRKANGKVESKKLACKDKLTIARVPHALDRAQSGVSVSVKLPDGRELVEQEVVVEDIFIVALGDSFASGESNPDRPVQFSAFPRDGLRSRARAAGRCTRARADSRLPGYGLAAAEDLFNPKVLPRRFMDDEAAGRFNTLNSAEFAAAFEKASARWLSRDCHRSQYGYPFRVAIQLALGESPPLRDSRKLHLLGRRGGRRAVRRARSARGQRQGARAVRPVERASVPRAAHAERQLHAAGVLAWQHPNCGAAVLQVLVSRRNSASGRSMSC